MSERDNLWKKERYYRRKAEGLCVRCGGEKEDKTKTMCSFCRKKVAYTHKGYYAKMSPEQKKANTERSRRWMQEHPEAVEVYKKRKAEYNRRYVYGEESDG